MLTPLSLGLIGRCRTVEDCYDEEAESVEMMDLITTAEDEFDDATAESDSEIEMCI